VIIYFVETEPAEQEYFSSQLAAHDVRFVSQLDEVGEDAEVLSLFINSRVTSEFLAAHPQLRFIATRSTAVDHLDMPACRERKLLVANVPDYGFTTVAEHTFALILALAVALVQGTLPLLGASRGDARLMALGRTAALTQAFLVILAFGALTQAYVTSDFSVANVVANSHSAKPLIYKLSGVWSNHEGSMLLWALILALFGAAVAIFGTNLPDSLRARVLAIQALIGVGAQVFWQELILSSKRVRMHPQASRMSLLEKRGWLIERAVRLDVCESVARHSADRRERTADVIATAAVRGRPACRPAKRSSPPAKLTMPFRCFPLWRPSRPPNLHREDGVPRRRRWRNS